MERNSIDQSCLEAGETELFSILCVGTERGVKSKCQTCLMVTMGAIMPHLCHLLDTVF